MNFFLPTLVKTSLRVSIRRASVQIPQQNQGAEKQQQRKNDYVLVDIKGLNSNVALVQLNRAKTFNTLSYDLIKELRLTLESVDRDNRIACIVLTGSTRAFAAGADIKEMQNQTLPDVIKSDFLDHWSTISKIRKPIVAAVNGLALGGGCELAMLCDIIYAGEKAEFGQPEIILGIIPGAGGTQRLPRSIGKSKAMEMILTGNRISAKEAQQIGLINSIYPVDQLVNEAIKTAEKIANHSKIVVQLAKEAVNRAYESSLAEGNRFEKRLFHTTFGLADGKRIFSVDDTNIDIELPPSSPSSFH